MYRLWFGLWFVSIFSMNMLMANDIGNEEGAKLFKQCEGCHGQRGEKHALGKSLVINHMTKQQITTSIEGYTNGTYGSNMRGLMKGQVAHLNRDQVEKIAVYIANLNSQYKLKSLPVQVKPPYDVSPLQKGERSVPDSFKMKIKTKRYAKKFTYVKAMIIHVSMTAKEAERKRIKQVYLTKIVVQEDNQSILEIKSTPYLSNNPLFKFKYQSHGGKEVSIRAYNNLGKSATHSVVIKDNPNSREHSTLHSDVQNKVITTLNDKAIYAYFGDVKLIPSDKIQLVGPALASNGGAVPIGVRSTIKANTVTLFAMEESGNTKMIVQWILQKQTLIDFQIKIKLDSYSFYGANTVKNYDANIYPASAVSVVVEGVDGKYYISTISIEVAIAGGN